MLHRPLLLLAALVSLSACGKDANTQMCLDEFAQFQTAVKAEDNKAQQMAGPLYQTCGISCDVTKDAEACAAFKTVTETICEKEGKEACEKLCNEGKGNSEKPEKNEAACAKLATLK